MAAHLPGTQREIPIRMPLLPARFPADDVYDRAAAEIAAALDAGDDVAVICEGDPFFYGSFMYLYGRLADRFPVEIVPGVSSLTACAAALGAPLSARNDVLTVLPGPLDAQTLKDRLAVTDAAAIIKVGRHFEKIRGVLSELGLLAGARYIERATMENQRIVPLEDVGAGDAPYFSMILVHRRADAWKP